MDIQQSANDEGVKPSSIGLERDILEWNLPEAVLSVLLRDHTTGRNLIWATDDYAVRGHGFAPSDEIQLELVIDKATPVIRPRVDKAAAEKRKRVEKRAEVFTPSWICNKQNNLVDAAWFNWKKGHSSPFNKELEKFNQESEFGWNTTSGRQRIKFPKGKTWLDYVKATRLEVSCGEAPYLTSRYDTVSGKVIPVHERIGLLDRKLRVITENTSPGDVQSWLFHAKLALQSVYGFDWQGDNVLLARENLLASVVEYFNAHFFNEVSSSLDHFAEILPPSFPGLSCLLEFAEIISWNVWQMDGIRGVVPMSCERNLSKRAVRQPMFDGTTETITVQCPGCKKNELHNHSGDYCMVMDWSSSSFPRPVKFVDLMGGNE